MMIEILFLVIVALILSALEMIVPGGVLGVLGGVALIAATVLGYQSYGTGAAMIIIIVGALLCLIVVFVEFHYLKNTKHGKRLFLNETNEGKVLQQSDDKDKWVGATGKAKTDLAPSGAVLIEGKSHEAFSQDGFISRGEAIEVRSVDNFRLLVGRKTKVDSTET